jgi:hypothetical protein
MEAKEYYEKAINSIDLSKIYTNNQNHIVRFPN